MIDFRCADPNPTRHVGLTELIAQHAWYRGSRSSLSRPRTAFAAKEEWQEQASSLRSIDAQTTSRATRFESPTQWKLFGSRVTHDARRIYDKHGKTSLTLLLLYIRDVAIQKVKYFMKGPNDLLHQQTP
jgi:hypothetical protein